MEDKIENGRGTACRALRSQKSEAGSQKQTTGNGKLDAGVAARNNILLAVVFSFFFFILASGFWLLTPLSCADEKNVKQERVPTVITSASLTADNVAKTALFTGSVVAKKGDTTFYADRMLVYYVESDSGNNIDRIEAEGNCKLVRGDRIITSGKLVYFAGAEERAIFTDSPRAAEGQNVVTGSKMTYYIKTDRSVVDNSKVFIVEKEQGARDRKPADKKQDKKKN